MPEVTDSTLVSYFTPPSLTTLEVALQLKGVTFGIGFVDYLVGFGNAEV